MALADPGGPSALSIVIVEAKGERPGHCGFPTLSLTLNSAAPYVGEHLPLWQGKVRYLGVARLLGTPSKARDWGGAVTSGFQGAADLTCENHLAPVLVAERCFSARVLTSSPEVTTRAVAASFRWGRRPPCRLGRASREPRRKHVTTHFLQLLPLSRVQQ